MRPLVLEAMSDVPYHLSFIADEASDTIEEFEWIEDARTLPFEQLIKMKWTSFRRKDQVHLLDIISIGLIDAT